MIFDTKITKIQLNLPLDTIVQNFKQKAGKY